MTVDWNAENAAHLIRRAGFGATSEEVARALDLGMDATVASLLDARGPSDRRRVVPRKTTLEELQLWWLRRIVRTRAPLEEKLTLFWHNHFATALDKVEDARLMHLQNRTLRAHAFGPFRDMVRAIARDPAMIVWLDNQTSVASDPNENFARELMEVFTTGVYDAAGNPTYTESDVAEAARAFTGWTILDGAFFFEPWNHDFSMKTFRGVTGPLDGDDVIENLVTDPATPRRLAGRLFTFFAHEVALSDPVLDPMVGAYEGNGTGIRPMLEVLFQMDAFYSAAARFSRVKSPVEFLAGTVRLLRGSVKGGRVGEGLARKLAALGQSLFNPPSVFGWKEGPSWVSSNGLLQRARVAEWMADSRRSDRPPFSWRPERLLGERSEWPTLDPGSVVARFVAHLDPSPPTDSTTASLVAYLQADDDGTPTPFVLDKGTIDRKVRGLVALLLSSPEYQLC